MISLTKKEKWLLGLMISIVLALIEIAFGPITQHRYTRVDGEKTERDILIMKEEIKILKDARLNRIDQTTKNIDRKIDEGKQKQKENTVDRKKEHKEIIKEIRSK